MSRGLAPKFELERDVVEWDGRAEIALGVFIRRYLSENQPPPGSMIGRDLEAWSAGLLHHGQGRLEAAGASHLRVAPQEA